MKRFCALYALVAACLPLGALAAEAPALEAPNPSANGARQATPAEGTVTTTLIYTPAVVIIPEVRTPDGEMRTYRTAQGVSYWHDGLPVYKGDDVKLNVFVSTGGATLAETRVRLDNKEISRRSEAPWNAEVDTGALEPGYHYVEAWAITGGQDPRDSTANLVFFVDPKQAPQADTASPVVGTVQPPADAPAPDIAPDQGGPAVRISADTPAAAKSLNAGERVTVAAPVIFSITGPGPEEGYVYSLYRGADEIYRSKVKPVGSKVQLRPDAKGAPGLLPGLLRFVVWGTDKQGRLGPPRVVEIEVPAQGKG